MTIKRLNQKKNIETLYSLHSSLFIIYLSSLLFLYMIYGFISYEFRIFDFVSENIPVKHPDLFVFLSFFIFLILSFLVLIFDKKRLSVLILHFFTVLVLCFLFININKNNWLEYENTLYIITSIFLLSLYIVWFINKLKILKIFDFVDKYSFYILIVSVLLYFIYFCFLSMERHDRFYSQMYDLAWEHQVLHNLATTGMPYSTIESKDGVINWADHTSFIYYLIAPFYRLFPDVKFILVLQVLSVCLASIFIFLFSNYILNNKFYSLIISFIFLLHPSVQGVLLFDFHPSTLALPLFFLALYFAEKNNFKATFVFILLLSLVREDFIFFSFFIVLYLIISKKIDLKRFLYLSGLIFIIFIISYFTMRLSGSVAPDYERFYIISNKFLGVVSLLFVNPLFIFTKLFDADKLNFILIFSLPFLFLFYLHRLCWIILIPALLFTVFSKHLPHYLIGYQYSIIFICAAFCGIVYYLKEKAGDKNHILLLMLIIVLFMNYFYGNIFSKSLRLVFVNPEIAPVKPDYIHKKWQGFYKELKGDKDNEIKDFIKTIPKDAKIAADNFIAPHLSARRYLYHIKNYDWADYIIDKKDNAGEFTGFTVIKETKMWKVYKKQVTGGRWQVPNARCQMPGDKLNLRIEKI